MAKILKTSFLFLLLLTSCSESTNHVGDVSSGHLYIENRVQSFGKVNKNETKEIRCYFPITNTGDSTIIISKLDISCSCISAEITSNNILPHKQEVVTVKINTSNRLGELNKSVFIKSNADNPVEIIRVKGHILD